jgi:sulfur-oxidizing protein SoxX
MHNTKHLLPGAIMAMLAGTVIIPTSATATIASASDATMIAAGEKIAFDRKKGNCLACHSIEGGKSPGNLGPSLTGMKVRYSDKAKLRSRIWDASTINPETAMPPFGSHQILSEQEIDQVLEFIWSK